MFSDQSITRIDDHGAGVVFLSPQSNGRVSVLVHDYTRRDGRGVSVTTLRVPFRTGLPGECVFTTLSRVVMEEVAEDPADFDFEVTDPSPVFWQVRTGDTSRERTHLQAIFTARHCRGPIRNTERVCDAGTDREKRLSPLRWFDLEDAVREMATSPTPRAHRLGVVSTLFWICRRDPDVAQNYAWLCARNADALRHFESHPPIVEEYLARR
jgi:hypothetical protein